MIINKKLSIAVADAYPLITSAMINEINKGNHFSPVFLANTGEDLMKKLNEKNQLLDVLLTDYNFSLGGNDDGYRLIKKIFESGRVKNIFIFSDMKDTLTLNQLMGLPLAGIISKRDNLQLALKIIANQCSSMYPKNTCYLSPVIQDLFSNLKMNAAPTSLTPREFEVIKLYAEGMRLKEIASHLKRSVGTVAVHKYNAMKKMNFSSNAQLIDFARQVDK